MSRSYRYFIVYERITGGPRGDTVTRNDVIPWPRPLAAGADIEEIEAWLKKTEALPVPTAYTLINFILLGIEDDREEQP